MKNIFIEKFNNFIISIGEYLGSKSQTTNISIKIQNIIYIALFAVFDFNIFLIIVGVMEILNFYTWHKQIKSGKLDKKLQKHMG